MIRVSHRSARALGLVSLLALSACAAVGPDPFAAPQIALPTSFDGQAGVTTRATVAPAFWAEYRDPMLSALLSRGLGQSLSILAANERIRAAEAGVRGAAPLSGQLGGETTVARERVGAEGTPSAAANRSSLNAGFVLDIFGGALRVRQGAEADLHAAEARAEVTRQAYVAEVIAAYSSARVAQESLALTRATVASRERTVDITRSRINAGTATQFELAQVQALLELTRSELPTLAARFDAQVYQLSVLLNEPADGLMRQMQRGAPQLRTPATPGTGVPADLLRARPDIRAAEQDMTAAVARVGVATADLLPSVSLIGRVSDVGASNAWGFGPQVSLPIFNQGGLRAARDRRISEARQAEIAWRASVTAAVGGVQTAQSNLRRYRQQVATLNAALSAYDRAYDLAMQSYEGGALPLPDLLEVDRARASTRLTLANARHASALEWAALQIATGAGAQQP
ncbi:efflux transporter outer membrane subunit [Pararhodobacter zhoushanensis]|uniref:Efflux transporter outer membrane subunit n=1 Tax=Pararhodobacter zhoushanensis TaxID=2479545 RepID=A0ABT3H500_9RHOB|nr:efflux transporter outer membrane subunit [Pararhodobacter zhoushanensis]MCW1934882.1 efflux transporter outer membrane subunit [Pararhodobacter zhoushanensis]